MWKIWCCIVFLFQFDAEAAKIPPVIGPLPKNLESQPLLTSFYTDIYAKIARGIIHDASEKCSFFFQK